MRSVVALLAVVAVVLLSAAGLFLAFAARRWSELRTLRSWRAVPAELLDARLEPAEDDERRVAVSFRFEVNGSRYVGTSLEHALSGPMPKARAEASLKRLRARSEHLARINPVDVERSVLESGAVPPPAVLIGLSAGLALVAAAVAFGALLLTR